MFKTLACLVVAMTATSALLGFIDPSQPVEVEPPPFETVLPIARGLVADDVDLRLDHWQGVEVLAGPDTTKYLTAIATESGLHFLVNVEGQMTRTSEWSRQDPRSLRPDLVRIRVARRGERERMTRAQWNAVRALVAAVDESISGVPATTVAIRFDEAWASVYGVEAGVPQETPLPKLPAQ